MWVSARGFIAEVRWEGVQGNIDCVRNPAQSSQSDRNWFQTHFQDTMFNNQKQAIFNDFMAFFLARHDIYELIYFQTLHHSIFPQQLPNRTHRIVGYHRWRHLWRMNVRIDLTFIMLISSALSNTTWTELSSFLASWQRSLSWRVWVEFSWQYLECALSSTSRVLPRSSSKSWCILWYCTRTSSFSCRTLSCTTHIHKVHTEFL